jgi:pyrrolysine biosynthesis protein PylD
MTRLQQTDIAGLGEGLTAYESRLRQMTGTGLTGIAAHACAKTAAEFEKTIRDAVVGVIPLSYGEGIIDGFAESVREIIEFLGGTAFVTQTMNVKGIAEAVERGATVLFLSDDMDFAAINIASGTSADNSECTGRAFAAALELMASGIQGCNVLVIGAGPVGSAAVRYLNDHGAHVFLYDRDPLRAQKLAETIAGVHVASDLPAALQQYPLVVEATPAADVIEKQWVTSQTMIAAPGVPLGIDALAQEHLAGRIIHDVLEIGVATMLSTALAE